MSAKSVLARSVKNLAATADRVRGPRRGVVVLIYHRVGAGSGLQVDLPVDLFAAQMEVLAGEGRVVTLDDALAALDAPSAPPGPDPVVITFDDGTADFADHAMPVLEQHGVPATLYVATSFVEDQQPFPADGTPLSWAALGDALSTGLLTVGSHTHTHALLDRAAPELVDDELDTVRRADPRAPRCARRPLRVPEGERGLARGRARRAGTVPFGRARRHPAQPVRPHRPAPARPLADPGRRRHGVVPAQVRGRDGARGHAPPPAQPPPVRGRHHVTPLRRRPRLVHVTTSDISLSLLLGPQLQAFAAAGYEVIGVSAAGDYVADLERMGIEHVALRHATRSFAPGGDARALLELWSLFRELQPDIVHTHNPKPGIYGRLAARAAGVPVVVNTVHGLYALPDDRLAKRAVVYGLERTASLCSDAELVQSAEDVDTLLRLGVPRDKVYRLGNGIDLDRFRPRATRGDAAVEARARLGIAPDDVVCGLVGRLVREKGYPEVFAAFEQLRDRLPQLRVVVVGPSDPEKPRCALGRRDRRGRACGCPLPRLRGEGRRRLRLDGLLRARVAPRGLPASRRWRPRPWASR